MTRVKLVFLAIWKTIGLEIAGLKITEPDPMLGCRRRDSQPT